MSAQVLLTIGNAWGIFGMYTTEVIKGKRGSGECEQSIVVYQQQQGHGTLLPVILKYPLLKYASAKWNLTIVLHIANYS